MVSAQGARPGRACGGQSHTPRRTGPQAPGLVLGGGPPAVCGGVTTRLSAPRHQSHWTSGDGDDCSGPSPWHSGDSPSTRSSPEGLRGGSRVPCRPGPGGGTEPLPWGQECHGCLGDPALGALGGDLVWVRPVEALSDAGSTLSPPKPGHPPLPKGPHGRPHDPRLKHSGAGEPRGGCRLTPPRAAGDSGAGRKRLSQGPPGSAGEWRAARAGGGASVLVESPLASS